jgi:hypothetical protein
MKAKKAAKLAFVNEAKKKKKGNGVNVISTMRRH